MTRMLRDMSRELAGQLAEAALVRAAELNIAVAVVVVDRGGDLVLADRMDGAATCAFPLALAKAETAAATLASTRLWFGTTQPGQPDWGMSAALGGRFSCMPGGNPVVVAGEIVGAVGVSGGEAEQDVACADAALTVPASDG